MVQASQSGSLSPDHMSDSRMGMWPRSVQPRSSFLWASGNRSDVNLTFPLCGEVTTKNEAKTEECRAKRVIKKEKVLIRYLQAMIQPERSALQF